MMRLAKSFAEIDSTEREPAQIRVKRFMPVGEILGSGVVSVSAFELMIPAKEYAFRGIRFEVSSGNEYDAEGVALVTLDDTARLRASLEQLASTRITYEQYAMTEVDVTVQDLRVIVFNTNERRIVAAVEANGTTCHLDRHADLLDLCKLVELAEKHILSNSNN